MIPESDRRKNIAVGIGGGTGSGKSTLAARIADALGPERVTLLDADAYYRDLSHMTLHERRQINFDHPDAVDAVLLEMHILQLKSNRGVEKPIYDFTRSCRSRETLRVEPRRVVLVEGILVLSIPEILRCFDLKIFVDEAADIRLIRRIRRDMEERGRSLESILDQYTRSVIPMFDAFVAPAMDRADLVVHLKEGTDRIIRAIETRSGPA